MHPCADCGEDHVAPLLCRWHHDGHRFPVTDAYYRAVVLKEEKNEV